MEVEPPTLTTHQEGGTIRGETVAARGGCGSKGDPVAGGLKDRDPRKWSEVSWKSVILARQDRDIRGDAGRQSTGGRAEDGRLRENGWAPTKDVTDHAGGGQGASDESERGGTVRQGGSRMMQATEASAMRQHARRREDEFLAGGAHNFYKPVRVCASCFRVRRLFCYRFFYFYVYAFFPTTGEWSPTWSSCGCCLLVLSA